MKVIGIITTAVVVLVFSAIWSGYVLTILWGWFVSPTFGLPELSIPAAIGIALIVGYMAKADVPAEKDDTPAGVKIGVACIIAFVKPALALLVGAVVNVWM